MPCQNLLPCVHLLLIGISAWTVQAFSSNVTTVSPSVSDRPSDIRLSLYPASTSLQIIQQSDASSTSQDVSSLSTSLKQSVLSTTMRAVLSARQTSSSSANKTVVSSSNMHTTENMTMPFKQVNVSRTSSYVSASSATSQSSTNVTAQFSESPTNSLLPTISTAIVSSPLLQSLTTSPAEQVPISASISVNQSRNLSRTFSPRTSSIVQASNHSLRTTIPTTSHFVTLLTSQPVSSIVGIASSYIQPLNQTITLSPSPSTTHPVASFTNLNVNSSVNSTVYPSSTSLGGPIISRSTLPLGNHSVTPSTVTSTIPLLTNNTSSLIASSNASSVIASQLTNRTSSRTTVPVSTNQISTTGIMSPAVRTTSPTKVVHSSTKKSKSETTLIVGLTVGLSLALIVFVVIVICYRRKRASYHYNVFYDEQNIVMNPFDSPRP